MKKLGIQGFPNESSTFGVKILTVARKLRTVLNTTDSMGPVKMSVKKEVKISFLNDILEVHWGFPKARGNNCETGAVSFFMDQKY